MKKTIRYKILTLSLIYSLLIVLTGCKQNASTLDDFNVQLYEPQYALGFEILGADEMESSIIITRQPWQGADTTSVSRLFISRNGEEPPTGFDGCVLKGEAKRIICMSSSYIAMLDEIGNADKVVGVSGMKFISNPKILSRSKEIGDVGYDGNIDYELLVALDPDLVLLYGVSGSSGMESKLKELGVPYMYVGEYMEEDPLGKAEWLVAVNEVTGDRQKAIERFEKIPAKYQELKEMVSNNASERPLVMVNTPYRDSWVMPSTSSYMPQLISDAGGNYIYHKDTGNKSMPIDIEEAYILTSQSDIWINVGHANTLDEVKEMCPKFVDTDCFKNGNVWNNTLLSLPSGGNEFWETSVVHPDVVLQDLIKIFHPELAEDCEFTYYKQLH